MIAFIPQHTSPQDGQQQVSRREIASSDQEVIPLEKRKFQKKLEMVNKALELGIGKDGKLGDDDDDEKEEDKKRSGDKEEKAKMPERKHVIILANEPAMELQREVAVLKRDKRQ